MNLNLFQDKNKKLSKLLDLLKNGNVVEFEKILKRDKNIDVNHSFGDPVHGTLLDFACRSSGNSKFVQILIENKADVDRINCVTAKYPIHEAIHNADKNTLTQLITHKELEKHEAVNLSFPDRSTPLHTVIRQKNTEFLEILLKNPTPPIKINILDDKNQTPLNLALREGNLEAVDRLLKFPDIDLNYRRDFEGKTCLQLIQNNYPHLLKQLEQLLYNDPQRNLWKLLYRSETAKFIEMARDVSPGCLDNNFNDQTYLQFACYAGFIDVVDMLLENGADPNGHQKKFSYNSSPLCIAAMQNKKEIFERLMKIPAVQKENDMGTVLYWVIQRMILTRRRKPEEAVKYEFFEWIVNEVIPEEKIAFGNGGISNLFHLALNFNDDQITKALLYVTVTYSSCDFRSFPWRTIKAAILEDYLDDCISSPKCSNMKHLLSLTQDHVQQKMNAITFNHKLFINAKLNPTERRCEMGFLFTIEKVPHLRKLLQHPVPKSFIHMKWSLVQKYYYFNLVIYFLFYLFLNVYIISYYNQKFSQTMNNSTVHNSSKCDDTIFAPIFKHGSKWVTMFFSIFANSSKWLAMMFYCIVTLREFYQFLCDGRSYFKSFENWLEIVIIFMTGRAFYLIETDSNCGSAIAAYAILTTSVEFVLLLGKLPKSATYIEIFKKVARNFFYFSVLYSALIISCAFSFYILFQNPFKVKAAFQNETRSEADDKNSTNFWESPTTSILKTITMFAGELGVDSLPFDATPSHSHFVFIIFVFLIAIILYNLLNGLAVSDTRAIAENAEFVALVSRVKLIHQLELLSTSKLFKLPFLRLLFSNGERIKLYGDNLYTTEIEVRSKKIYLLKKVNFDAPNPAQELFSDKMPSSIVERALEILDNRRACRSFNCIQQQLKIDAMKEHRQKFQSIDKLGQNFTAQIRELKSKIDEENVNRDKNLIQRITTFEENMKKCNSTLEANMEQRNSTLQANMEQRISTLEANMGEMKTLLESVAAAIQKQNEQSFHTKEEEKSVSETNSSDLP